MASLLIVAIVLLARVVCDCSIYPDEDTCNNRIGYRCVWNASGTKDSEKCSAIWCSDYTTAETCAANNGVLGCKWDDAAYQKCHAPTCSDYNNSEADCVQNGGNNLNCVYRDGKCRNAQCLYFDNTEENCTTNGKVDCNWDDDSTFLKCSEQKCGDYNATAEACAASNTKLLCKFTAGADGAANVCESISFCSDYTSVGETACVNSQVFDCRWNNNACSTQACQYIKDKSVCNNRPACYWSALLDCWDLGCSDFAHSQTVCESEHPVCHYKGSCKEGSGAFAAGVPSLIMMLLLFLSLIF